MSAVKEHMDEPGPLAAGSETDTPLEIWKRLFDEVASGRRQALDELYDLAARQLYGLALWRTGSPEDAGDVVQEVFLRIAQKRHQLTAVRDPRAWLFTLAHRAAVDVTRRRSRRKAMPIEECRFLEASAADSDRAVDARRASHLLAQLPAAQRDVIYLHLFADCTFAAVGDIVGVPTFTAASRFRLGMKKLRRMMETDQ